MQFITRLLRIMSLAAVLMFVTSVPAWGQCEQLLRPRDGSRTDNFGASIAGNSGLLVIGQNGQFLNPIPGDRSGPVTVFRRDGSAWIEEAQITISDPGNANRFGSALAIEGDVLAIGAWGDDDRATEAGAVYIFRRSGAGDWVQEAKLTASDAAYKGFFGHGVALTGGDLLVGASGPYTPNSVDNAGALYVFRGGPDGWHEVAKLVPDDLADDDQFGWWVAADGDRAVVSAGQHDAGGDRAGAVYVFRRDGDSWAQEAKLLANDASSGQGLGRCAIGGDRVIAGAVGDGERGDHAGAAYVFRRDEEGWRQEAKLFAGDAAPGALFGYGVSIDGVHAMAGAIFDDDACPGEDECWSGAAYLFSFDGTGWTESAKLRPIDNARGDRFGQASSISGDTIFVAAPLKDNAPNRDGAAYVFSATELSAFSGVFADANRDGRVDIFDIFCVLDAYVGNASNCPAENVDLASASGQCERDGVIDIFDILAVLDAFAN